MTSLVSAAAAAVVSTAFCNSLVGPPPPRHRKGLLKPETATEFARGSDGTVALMNQWMTAMQSYARVCGCNCHWRWNTVESEHTNSTMRRVLVVAVLVLLCAAAAVADGVESDVADEARPAPKAAPAKSASIDIVSAVDEILPVHVLSFLSSIIYTLINRRGRRRPRADGQEGARVAH